MGDIMRPIPFEELLTRIFDGKHGGITTENHGPVRRWHKHMCRRRD